MPTLGLCVIAKNAAPTLRACLDSVRGLVQAMVVVDTGSSDATVAVARDAGATVLHFPWANDFAAARNAALQAMKTDWILVLDADEELDRKARIWIRRELKRPRAEGYIVPVRNYLAPWSEVLPGHIVLPPRQKHPRAPLAPVYAVSQVCRLYRRRPDVYYVGAIHEQVDYRLMELGLPIARAGFFIHHFGWYRIQPSDLSRKYSFYKDLLAKKLEQRPDDPQVMVQYGDALSSWCGQHQEALTFFMKAAALAPDKHQVWTHMATCLLALKQPEAALVAVDRIPSEGEEAGRRFQLRGEALIALGRWHEALAAYREAARYFPDHAVVTKQWAWLETQYGDRDTGCERLKDLALQSELQAQACPGVRLALRAAECYALLQQWPEVLRLAQEGLEREPHSAELQDMKVKAAVATGDFHEAADAAARLAELVPSPRSVLRHVALLHQSGNGAAAEAAISHGLEQFPLSDELQAVRRELEQGSALATA